METHFLQSFKYISQKHFGNPIPNSIGKGNPLISPNLKGDHFNFPKEK